MPKQERYSPPAVAQNHLPAQDGWARRAERVRGPVSGFVFRFQAQANVRALEVEKVRVAAARGVMHEYAGLFDEIRTAYDSAIRLQARRELAADFFDEEVNEQLEAIEEAKHRREVARKRREKELTEAETRRVEAEHEQEAVERFKEPKFAAGFARFEEKQKGYQVGAASADEAIRETKTANTSACGNEDAEVLQLYALLRDTVAAIEEGERVGRDTQALRERAELYKKLLNLA